ncbi:MAG: (2Fe-2S)-binding protein, partial [Alphaproteobacteria bacterium]
MTATERKSAKRVATAAERDALTEEGLPPANRVICACTNLTFARLEEAVTKVHSHSFDALLEETGAGRTCTACLLDLEYYFVTLKARAPRDAEAGAGSASSEVPAQRSWKYRLYDWLDSVSPPIAWASPNRIPIVAGRDIETWLTVTNHDLLFDERKS